MSKGAKTLPLVDNLFKKDYKNIVILIMDGLGTCIMENNLKEDGFLGEVERVYGTTW